MWLPDVFIKSLETYPPPLKHSGFLIRIKLFSVYVWVVPHHKMSGCHRLIGMIKLVEKVKYPIIQVFFQQTSRKNVLIFFTNDMFEHLRSTIVVWLVVSTHLKNISQIGNLPQIGMKIKNIWNHHLVVFVQYQHRLPRKHHTQMKISQPQTTKLDQTSS